ncbi:MAG: acyl phosphate:glycerol-3-phosphate acyltransferase [Bacteroidales bacterium]|jgi:glycerol-3-phosphate acyltransferase PlsY|nr:acyl phosphate:glycerol-3-phosphate acyltransferase [Bacteroidales bacterium]
MHIVVNILITILAYLLGSIPTSIWISRFFFNIDIRDYGSGNAGTTNTFRVLGTKPGIVVFIVDVLKGFLAVNLIYLTDYYIPESGDYINIQLLLGIAAMLGHIFPIYASFRGGKGVATLFGVICAISFYPALIMAGIFVLTLVITRYVSLSSMISGLSFPVLIIVVFKETTSSLVIFSLIMAVLMLFTHQKNIERLLNKEEKKANFSKLKKKNRKDSD